jgi:hypothetical protein
MPLVKDYNRAEEHKNLIEMEWGEFEKYMLERYPLLIESGSPSWGFEIGPGWRPLINELFSRLELLVKTFNAKIEFQQIKEKFGSGRFYFSLSFNEDRDETERNIISDIISDVVTAAEERAYYICAKTGEVRYRHSEK